MVDRVGSFRCKTRHTLRKIPRDSGKVSITRQLQQFNVGDAVTIKQEPAIQLGMPHPRYKNRTGVVTEKRGDAYVVKIRDGNSTKILLARPVHLVRVKNG